MNDVKRYSQFNSGYSMWENCDGGYVEYADYAQRVQSLEAQLAAALKDKARLVEMVLNIDKERTLYARRLAWLHDCSGNMTDADGCEWGIFRVKNNKDGQVVEAWHTFSDFSDLDAEIRRDGWILPDIAATPHQGAEKHDVLLGPCACGAWHLPGDLTAQSIDDAIAAAKPARPGKLEGETVSSDIISPDPSA